MGASIAGRFSVATTEGWDDAVSRIKEGGNDKNYIIDIPQDIYINGTAEPSFGTVTELQISLRGDFDMNLLSNGNALNIGAGQSVVARDVDFVGQNGNDTSLIYVTGDSERGALTLRSNASVSGNSSSVSYSGGGVYIDGHVDFTIIQAVVSVLAAVQSQAITVVMTVTK